jgi:Phage tail tube protein
MPAGLGGSGSLGFAFETTKGTYVAPTTFIPILSEDFKYVEDRYFSPQIRQEVIVSDVLQGPYHIEGDIEMEADCNFLPYLLYCTRHNIAKTGSGPYEYEFTPSNAGSTSTAASGLVQRTASITIVRNEQAFGYAGCTLGSFGFMIDDDHVLKFRATLLGEEEAGSVSNPTESWVAPELFGADASSIYTDAAGATPAFGGAAVEDFNGFEFEANHNPEAQNRIVSDRSAQYISFGETEVSLNTELDFIDKTEYDNFVATTQKAIRLESLFGGASYAAASAAVRVDINRGVYETYDLGLEGLGDLIMAGVTMRGIGIATGTAYKITVKGAPDIS